MSAMFELSIVRRDFAPMLDPNNQNYFSLDEQPVTAVPWWKVRKFQVQLAVIAAVIIGVGVVGYYAYQTYSLTHVDIDALNRAGSIIDEAKSSCATADNVSECEENARADAARVTGEVSVCDGLAEAKLLNCVSLIASDNADSSLCSMLSGDDETKCQDGATLVAAKKAKDYGMCAAITDTVMKIGCQGQLVDVVIANGECEKYGIDALTCDFPSALSAVVLSGDPNGCAVFTGDQKAGCEDVFTSIDGDEDGLSLFDESELGTSDQKADTDGDGYTDLQEVETGHDPLKP